MKFNKANSTATRLLVPLMACMLAMAGTLAMAQSVSTLGLSGVNVACQIADIDPATGVDNIAADLESVFANVHSRNGKSIRVNLILQLDSDVYCCCNWSFERRCGIME